MVFPAASRCRCAAGERPGSLASADPETTKTWATAQVLRSVSGVQRTAPCRGPFARTKHRTGATKSQLNAPAAIRTRDLRLRRPTLYPAELLAREAGVRCWVSCVPMNLHPILVQTKTFLVQVGAPTRESTCFADHSPARSSSVISPHVRAGTLRRKSARCS